MFNMLLLVHLITIPSLVSSGGFAAYLTPGGESISIIDTGGESVFVVDAEPGERLSYMVFRDLKLVFLSSSRGLLQTDVLSGETEVLSSQRTGSPWLSSDGSLWYTFSGSLYGDGLVVNENVPAFHVSVENGTAAYTDRNDVLHILNIDTGTERMVEGYRFYAPIVLESGDVIAPTLSGAIVFLPVDGSLMLLGSGEQPCWSDQLNGLFYCVSEDDGHQITAADIWFVRPGEEPVTVTSTPDILETRPSCSGEMLWFVDEGNGTPSCMSLDDLSL